MTTSLRGVGGRAVDAHKGSRRGKSTRKGKRIQENNRKAGQGVAGVLARAHVSQLLSVSHLARPALRPKPHQQAGKISFFLRGILPALSLHAAGFFAPSPLANVPPKTAEELGHALAVGGLATAWRPEHQLCVGSQRWCHDTRVRGENPGAAAAASRCERRGEMGGRGSTSKRSKA